MIGQQPAGTTAQPAMDVDDGDGFGPIRTTRAITQSAEARHQADNVWANQYIANSCMAFLAIVPILQSSSGEPTRDKALTDMVLNCSEDKFLLVGPIYFGKVRQKILNISLNIIDSFLDKFD